MKLDGNITELNDLVHAGAVVVKEMLGDKKRKNTGIEPWWKRRMEVQVKQLNKDLGHINTLTERKNIKKKHKDGLERRYKLKQRGLPVTREEIKERIKAKNNKRKRYQSIESTSINKTAPSRTIKESFIGSSTVEEGTLKRQKFLIRKKITPKRCQMT